MSPVLFTPFDPLEELARFLQKTKQKKTDTLTVEVGFEKADRNLETSDLGGTNHSRD